MVQTHAHRRSTRGFMFVVVAAAAIAAMPMSTRAQPRAFWVPNDGDPAHYPSGTTVIDASPGRRVCVELWLQGMDGSYYSNSATAAVYDRGQFGVSGSVRADCGSVAINTDNPRDAGYQLNTTGTTGCGSSGEMGLFALLRGFANPLDSARIVPAPGATYFGEVCYDVSADASGEFTIAFIPPICNIAPGCCESPIVLGLEDFECLGTVGDALVIDVVCDGPCVGCCLGDSCVNLPPDDCDTAGGFHAASGKLCNIVDCNGNSSGDLCDIAAGRSQDCNGNGVPDECDTAALRSRDCNDNSVPDECLDREGDCNNNGRPDECDITDGISLDTPLFNRPPDGVPDECQTRTPTPIGTRIAPSP